MKILESTRSSLTLRLAQRQRERWPDLEQLTVRFRGEFAYVDAATPDSDREVPAAPSPPLRGQRYLLGLRHLHVERHARDPSAWVTN